MHHGHGFVITKQPFSHCAHPTDTIYEFFGNDGWRPALQVCFGGTFVAARKDPGSSSSNSATPLAERRRRRAVAAFILGAAISAAGLAALAANRAVAHGPFTNANPTSFAVYQPTYSLEPLEAHVATTARPRRGRRTTAAISGRAKVSSSYAGSGPVCVRLCDGAFFPLDQAAGDAASLAGACGSQCPDAPTEVYYRNGSDRIEDAISDRGQRYTALPVSLRFRKSSDATCTCHRDVIAYAPLSDATLRRGDAIMTPAGVVVFGGAEGVAHRPSDFTALANARLSRAQRGALQAIEQASVARNHPTLHAWLTSQKPPALARRGDQRGAGVDDKIRLVVWRGGDED